MSYYPNNGNHHHHQHNGMMDYDYYEVMSMSNIPLTVLEHFTWDQSQEDLAYEGIKICA